MPQPKPPYPAQFRQQIIELVQAGRKPSELAAEFGCHVSTIHNWLNQANSKAQPPGLLNPDERAELQQLRRKVRQLQEERDILAKATAWFANKGPTSKTSMP